MQTLPLIPEKPFHQEIENQPIMKLDAFEKQMNKHDHSKTDQFLNLIYSILVGILSGVISKKHFKYAKILGLLMALSSYIISRNASKISVE